MGRRQPLQTLSTVQASNAAKAVEVIITQLRGRNRGFCAHLLYPEEVIQAAQFIRSEQPENRLTPSVLHCIHG
jgi:hypothetical protein